jgi:hypothetical protein
MLTSPPGTAAAGSGSGGGGSRKSNHLPHHTLAHGDLYKLSEISFGECDFHIRLNAIQQLNILLTKDSENFLLSTINRKWCLEICEICLERIQEFDWYSPSPSAHGTTSGHDLISPEAETSLFSLQTIILLRNILLVAPDLHENVLLCLPLSPSPSLFNNHQKTMERSLDLTPLLISILKYRLMDSYSPHPPPPSRDSEKSSIFPFDLRHYELFHLLCYEIIIFILSSSFNSSSLWHSWNSHRIHSQWNLFPSQSSPLPPPSSSPGREEINLQLPSFLWDDLCCFYPGHDLFYLYQKYCLQFHCSPVLLHIHHKTNTVAAAVADNEAVTDTDQCMKTFLEPTIPQHDRYSSPPPPTCLLILILTPFSPEMSKESSKNPFVNLFHLIGSVLISFPIFIFADPSFTHLLIASNTFMTFIKIQPKFFMYLPLPPSPPLSFFLILLSLSPPPPFRIFPRPSLTSKS